MNEESNGGMKVILPKTWHFMSPEGGPSFFLAGPVRGGGDWQHQCCVLLEQRIGKFYAAIPYYHAVFDPATHPLRGHVCESTAIEPGEVFERQLDWERAYMEAAAFLAHKGCLIFWLPEESKEKPRGDGAYATDTRGEIGEWRGRMMAQPFLRVVVGGEMNFPSISQIKRNFCHALKRDFPIYPTLAATVDAAIEMARKPLYPRIV